MSAVLLNSSSDNVTNVVYVDSHAGDGEFQRWYRLFSLLIDIYSVGWKPGSLPLTQA